MFRRSSFPVGVKVARLSPLFRFINVNMKLFLFLYFRFGLVWVATRLYQLLINVIND